MTIPTAITSLGQAIFAAVLCAAFSLAYFHFTAAGDAARDSHTPNGSGAL